MNVSDNINIHLDIKIRCKGEKINKQKHKVNVNIKSISRNPCFKKSLEVGFRSSNSFKTFQLVCHTRASPLVGILFLIFTASMEFSQSIKYLQKYDKTSYIENLYLSSIQENTRSIIVKKKKENIFNCCN